MTGALMTGAALAGGLYLRHRDEEVAMPGSVEASGEKLSGIVKSQYSTNEKPNSLKDITTYNNYYEFGTDKDEPAGLQNAISARRALDGGSRRRWSRSHARLRHRRHPQARAARRAHLSHALRRRLVDGDSVDRLSAVGI